jgi:hypothetical protein
VLPLDGEGKKHVDTEFSSTPTFYTKSIFECKSMISLAQLNADFSSENTFLHDRAKSGKSPK